MKKQKYKIKNANDGITLIALVITIIVMLILVAVTVTMAVNGGLFGYAQDAARKTNNAMADEQALGNGRIKIGNVWYDSPQEYVDALTGKTTTDTDYCETCGNLGLINGWKCSNDNCEGPQDEPIFRYYLEFICHHEGCNRTVDRWSSSWAPGTEGLNGTSII